MTDLHRRCDLASWILAGLALLAVLKLSLLPALLAGLLVYELVHVLAGRLGFLRVGAQRGKLVSVALLATLVVLVLIVAGYATWAFVRSDAGSASALLAKLAEIVEGARGTLPEWAGDMVPDNVDDLKAAIVEWLREHAKELQHAGAAAGLGAAHLLVGMVIGAMVSLADARPEAQSGPLSHALHERAVRLGEAFRRIVFAQVKISALNTVLTAIFLWAVLPMFGIKLPLLKTMVVVTFLAGLLPVIGNLISNTAIFVIALNVSVIAAVGALLFLIVIHKLEYFINAKIVGSRINARVWELLIAMVIMERLLGIVGVVAAPVFYAWLKAEWLAWDQATPPASADTAAPAHRLE